MVSTTKCPFCDIDFHNRHRVYKHLATNPRCKAALDRGEGQRLSEEMQAIVDAENKEAYKAVKASGRSLSSGPPAIKPIPP